MDASAQGWLAPGHARATRSSSEHATQDAELLELSKSIGATIQSVAEVPRAAEVVVLAMPFTALDEVLAVTGELAGKLVVDCTNAVERGALKYGHTARRRRSCRSGCRKRRCSSRSTPRAENLENPSYDGLPSTNFFCGDDSEGRKVMKQLVEDVGFDAMDAGPLKNARLLWVASSKALGARDLAFRVVRR